MAVRRGAHGARPDLAAQTEGQTQPGLVRWLRLVLPVGSIVAAVTNEGVGVASEDDFGRARYFEARKAQGVETGFFDLICLCPGPTTVLLETKRPIGGVLSVKQQRVHARAREIGHHTGIAVDPETALDALLTMPVALRNVRGISPRKLVLLEPGERQPKSDGLANVAYVRLERQPTAIDDPLPI